jgi:hypothetical protein
MKEKKIKEKKVKDDDNTIRLMLAYLCIAKEAEASIVRKVEILDRFGLTDSEIAKVCKTNTQVIQNSRQVLKKKPHVKKKKK